MVASAADCIEMQVAFGGCYKALPEIFKAVCLKSCANACRLVAFRHSAANERSARKLCIAHKIRPAAKVYSRAAQRLVHRIKEEARAQNAFAAAQSFVKSRTERNSGVLHQMRPVNVKVAAQNAFKVKHAVLAECAQHVVEKPDRAVEIASACAVKV